LENLDLFICKENFRYVFIPGKALKRRALPKSSPPFLNYCLTHAPILVMPSTEGLTLHFVWSYGNIRDKKERGEFAQFGTLAFGQAHDPCIIICPLSLHIATYKKK
jgi:hypothetical protein